MVFTSSTDDMIELVETIKCNLLKSEINVEDIFKLRNVLISSKEGPSEAGVLKSVFEVITNIYETEKDLNGEKDNHFHSVVRECIDCLCNLLKKNENSHNDLCQPAIDVLIAVSKKQKENILLKSLSNSLLDIVIFPHFKLSIRKEFLKALNFILENSDRAERYKLKNIFKLEKLSQFLFTCGDYDTQVSIVETLYRFFPPEDRKIYAQKWFKNYAENISAFLSIKDFEPDCRKFLIKFNNSLNHNRLVYSIPCIKALVGNDEVQKPEHPEYTDFWVDFNLGSKSISLICSQESLYSQSAYSSQIEPGFWESLVIECQSVSKVTLQQIFQSSPSKETNGGKLEMKFIFNQPSNIIFSSHGCNFEGNMLSIFFSHAFLSTIHMLLQKIFVDNYYYDDLKFVARSQQKRRTKSSSGVSSTEDFQWGNSNEKQAKQCMGKSSLEEERTMRGTSLPVVQMRKSGGRTGSISSLKSNTSSNSNTKANLSVDKVSNSSSRANSKTKSPFKPLEIIISPCGNIQRQQKGNIQSPENKALPASKVDSSSIRIASPIDQECESICSSEKRDKESGAIGTTATNSNNGNEVERGNKETANDVRPNITSHGKKDKEKKRKRDRSPENEPQDNLNKGMVLRSQRRSPSKNYSQYSNEDAVTKDSCASDTNMQTVNMHEKQFQVLCKKARMEHKQLLENPQTEREHGGSLEKADVQKHRKTDLSRLSLKNMNQSTFDLSDTDSDPVWISNAERESRKMFQNLPKANKNRSHGEGNFRENTTRPQEKPCMEEIRKIPEDKELQNINEAKQLERGENKMESNGKSISKKSSSKKRLFNGADIDILGPIPFEKAPESTRCGKDTMIFTRNTSRNISSQVRSTVQKKSIVSNWSSGTESVLSWLKDAGEKKACKPKRYSNPRKSTQVKGGRKTKKSAKDTNTISRNSAVNQPESNGSNKERLSMHNNSRAAQKETTKVDSDKNGNEQMTGSDINDEKSSPVNKVDSIENIAKSTNKLSLKLAKHVTETNTRQTFENDPPQKDNEADERSTRSMNTRNLEKNLNSLEQCSTLGGTRGYSSLLEYSAHSPPENIKNKEMTSNNGRSLHGKTMPNNSTDLHTRPQLTAKKSKQPSNEVSKPRDLRGKSLGSLSGMSELQSVLNAFSKSRLKQVNGGNEATCSRRSSDSIKITKIFDDNAKAHGQHIPENDDKLKSNRSKCEMLSVHESLNINDISTAQMKRIQKICDEQKDDHTLLSVSGVDISMSEESDDGEEDYIPPSCITVRGKSLGAHNSAPQRTSTFNDKNITTRRGSCYNLKSLSAMQKEKPICSKNNIMKRLGSLLEDSVDLRNPSNNLNSKLLQAEKRSDFVGCQTNERLAGVKRYLRGQNTSKKSKLDNRKKCQIPSFEQTPATPTLDNSPNGRTLEETELEAMITDFDAIPIMEAQNPLNTDFEVINAQDTHTEDDSEIEVLESSINRDEKQLLEMRHSNTGKNNKKSISKTKDKTIETATEDVHDIKAATRKLSLENYTEASKKLRNFKKPQKRTASLTGNTANAPLNIGQTHLMKLVEDRSAKIADDLQELREKILKCTKETENQLKKESVRHRMPNYSQKLHSEIMALEERLNKSEIYSARFEKCYKYFSNTVSMKEQEDEQTKEILNKIKTSCEDLVKTYSKVTMDDMGSQFRAIMSEKLKSLKDNYIQKQKKEEMDRVMGYMKSLMLL